LRPGPKAKSMTADPGFIQKQYCPKCLTQKPRLHKHDPALVFALRWVGIGISRLGRSTRPPSKFDSETKTHEDRGTFGYNR
jgi:hypothetical protein